MLSEPTHWLVYIGCRHLAHSRSGVAACGTHHRTSSLRAHGAKVHDAVLGDHMPHWCARSAAPRHAAVAQLIVDRWAAPVSHHSAIMAGQTIHARVGLNRVRWRQLGDPSQCMPPGWWLCLESSQWRHSTSSHEFCDPRCGCEGDNPSCVRCCATNDGAFHLWL